MKENKKKHPTMKVLLWSVLVLAAVFSATCLPVCIIWAREELGAAIAVIGGLWSASVPVVVGVYGDRAKASDEHAARMAELDKEAQPQLEELRAQLTAAETANKKLKSDLDKAKRERDKALAEAVALQQRLTPLEEIIRQNIQA